jgi:hypothetical protein
VAATVGQLNYPTAHSGATNNAPTQLSGPVRAGLAGPLVR